MIKKLIKHGNSYALIIDKPIMELLHLTPETPLELTTHEGTLIVTPLPPDSRQAKLTKVMDEVNKQFGPAFKKLAE